MPSGNHLNLDAMTAAQADKEVTHNENVNEVQGALCDFTSQSVAGGATVNLDNDTVLYSTRLELTGLLTANIAVDLPDRKRKLWIKNSTTGDFTLTARPTGGAGLVIPRGLDFGLYHFESADAMRVLLHPRFGVHLFHSTTQSIANATPTVLTWDSETHDDAQNPGFHNPGSNPSRITIPASMGITAVKLVAQVVFAADADGDREIRLLKNGAATFAGRGRNRLRATATLEHASHVETPRIAATAADFFEVEVLHDAGAALDVAGGNNQSWFALEVLA
jgi:hypothetical protein